MIPTQERAPGREPRAPVRNEPDGTDSNRPPCAICEYARAVGSWPSDHRGTHCRDCHRSWSGLAEAHCRVCHLHFTADSVADLHEPYCTPAPVEASQALREAARRDGKPIFALRERKDGTAWVRWDARPHPEAAL